MRNQFTLHSPMKRPVPHRVLLEIIVACAFFPTSAFPSSLCLTAVLPFLLFCCLNFFSSRVPFALFFRFLSLPVAFSSLLVASLRFSCFLFCFVFLVCRRRLVFPPSVA